MSLVMLVEDEAVLRDSMARTLRRLPNVAVVEAGRMDEARQLIRDQRPNVVVSDLSLPDGSGIELLAEMDAVGLDAPVLFVTAYLGHYRELIPRRPDIEVFEKPLRMDTLRKMVQERVSQVQATNSSPFSVTDYLQLAGMTRQSVVLRLVRNHRQFGRVTVVEGQPWSARAGGITGAAAVRRLLFATGYAVEVQPLVGDPGLRNLEASMDHLLLDAAREHDEATRPPHRVPSVVVPPAAPEEPSVGDIDAAIEALETGEWATPGLPFDPAAARADAPAPPSAAPAAAPPSFAPVAAVPVERVVSGAPAAMPPSFPPAERVESVPALAVEPEPEVRSMRDWVDETPEPRPAPQPEVRSMRDWVDEADEPGPARRWGPDWLVEASAHPEPASEPAPAVRSMRDWEDATPRSGLLPPEPAPEPEPLSPEAARFDTLLDDGLDALLSRDYAAAWQAFSEAESLMPGDPVVRANLTRIRELGHAPESD